MTTCTDIDYPRGDHNYKIAYKEKQKKEIVGECAEETIESEPLFMYCTYCGRRKELE